MASRSRLHNVTGSSVEAVPVQRERRGAPLPLIAAWILVATFHLPLLLWGSYRHTYDAWVHIFFGDHYQRGWFSTWEPRWYTGFSTVTYPPGTHQLLATVGIPFGLERAFVIVATLAVFGLVTGVYRSSLLWVDRESAAYAALLVAVSSSIAETLHTFGQLPTLVSLAFALNGLPSVDRWVRTGRFPALAAALAFAAATTAVHHVTTLFGVVFILSPVLVRGVVDALRTPRPGEPSTVRINRSTGWPYVVLHLRRVLPALVRAAGYVVLVVVTLVLVVLPYWLESAADPITQVTIPHGSRANFLVESNAGLMFFAVPWGPLLLALPYAVARGLFGRAWPLMGSVVLLAVLGTGGTTPIPRLILGGAFDILTLDRFTFWATILILPLAGRMLSSLVSGRLRAVVERPLGPVAGRILLASLVAVFLGTTVFAATLSRFRPLQPAEIDMTPIVSFLEQDRHDQWRYLTLGFGDQMAWLSAQTTAETVDGNYHAARRLPELTTRPVERLEGAKYTGVAGLGSLQQFLSDPEKFHLKFVFSNDHFYDPLLWASGWEHLEPLENGIDVWQRGEVTPLPPDRVVPDRARWQRLWWGLVPPLSVLGGILAGASLLVIRQVGEPGPRRLRVPWAERAWHRFDARLSGPIGRLETVPAEPFWLRWERWRRGVARILDRPAPPRRRTRSTVAVMVVLALIAGVGLMTRPAPPPRPDEVVYAYYDALDLRRPDDAYRLLDPGTAPSWEQFVAERRVTNGLAASYARLEAMEEPEVTIAGHVATVRVRLSYLTALNRIEITTTEELRLVDGRWGLQYRPVDATEPTATFRSEPTLDYVAQGRRQATAGATPHADTLDLPEAVVHSADLVLHDGNLSVIGELTNISSVPSLIIGRAVLYDRDGNELAAHGTGVGSQPTTLPNETTPFRIDFEGVAGENGTEDMTFEPGAFTPTGIDPADVATVVISVQTLVTGSDLHRDAVVVDYERLEGRLDFSLFNGGAEEFTVSEVFVSLRDHTGHLRWVENAFSDEAARPDRTVAQTLTLPSPTRIVPVPVTIVVTVNGRTVTTAESPTERVEQWDDIDLSVMSFIRITG
ncbi:MAG: hypothetical protein ACK5PP_18825 [Acidimicrobiales bacterium]